MSNLLIACNMRMVVDIHHFESTHCYLNINIVAYLALQEHQHVLLGNSSVEILEIDPLLYFILG